MRENHYLTCSAKPFWNTAKFQLILINLFLECSFFYNLGTLFTPWTGTNNSKKSHLPSMFCLLVGFIPNVNLVLGCTTTPLPPNSNYMSKYLNSWPNQCSWSFYTWHRDGETGSWTIIIQRLHEHRTFIQTDLGFNPRSITYCEALGKSLNPSAVLINGVKINNSVG